MTTNLRTVLAAAVTGLALAGCAGSGHPAQPAVTRAPSAAATRPGADAAAPFGTPERVTDAAGDALTVTPIGAWWLPGNIQSRHDPQAASEGLSPAENGSFLIIEMHVKAASGSAEFPAPISGAGPAIISHHQMFSDAGTNASDNVVWNTCLPSVDSDVVLHPGSYLTDGETYDVPGGHALLAWLVGTQGASAATWQVPARSTGRLPRKVLTAINTGSGC